MKVLNEHSIKKKTVRDLPVSGKKVLVRVDYNVPIQDGKVTDATRIIESLPTLRYLLEQNAAVILCAHLGRPKGSANLKYSLEPVGKSLSELLGKEVFFAKDCIGPEASRAVAALKLSQVLLLENLRFHAQEEKNEATFSKELASLADFFIQDAFGAVHRAHASTTGVAQYLPSAAGFLFQKEVAALAKLLDNPEHPFLAILGGAKVSDKIEVIQNLSQKTDQLAIGGGMAYTFLKAQGFEIGKSLLEPDKMDLSASLMKSKVELVLPLDHIIAEKFEAGARTQITGDQNILEGWIGMDVGPKTLKRLESLIQKAKTIFWNGPLGVFEIPEFSQGTMACAKMVAQASEKGAFSVVGGGDSVAALNQSGCAKSISHISTGGGASLEFLEGKGLPGIEVLPNEA